MVSSSIPLSLLRSLTVKVFCNALIASSSVRWLRTNCVPRFGLNVRDSQRNAIFFQTLADHTIDGELFTFQRIVAVFPNRECQLLILTIQLWNMHPADRQLTSVFSLVNLAQPRPTIGKYFCSTMSRRFSSAMVLPRIMRDCSSWISGADSGDELGIISLRPLRMALPCFCSTLGPEYLPDKLACLTASKRQRSV